jgi:kinesin family protein 5
LNTEPLKIKEDKDNGIYVKGMTEIYVREANDVFVIMKRAYDNRSVGVTNMNEQSSRSHCIFIMTVKSTNQDTMTCKKGKLCLVDLAGSEKVSKTGAEG